MAHSIATLIRRDRSWLVALVLVVALFGATVTSFLTQIQFAFAAAPTGASAVMQNSTATTVDIVITGTDFVTFATSGTATAAPADLAGISYNAQNPSSATIDDVNTITATFPIAIGTGKSGGSLTIDAGILLDAVAAPNLLITIVDGSITDSAKPVLASVVLSNASYGNIITYNYTENMTFTTGVTTTARGDITTAGTVAGIGSFATTGDVTVPTTRNYMLGTGTAALELQIARGSGYIDVTSTTEPSGVFTPVASAEIVDAASNQVETSVTPVASGGGSWDLTPPTITSVTLSDADGDGRIDTATFVMSEGMRDDALTNSRGSLGGNAGTFASGTTDDDTTVFTVTTDDLAVDTSATAADFLYTPVLAYERMMDAAGNLLNSITDGTVASGDVTEADGAAPVVVSVSPADASTGASRFANIVITFSEAMNTTFVEGGEYAFSPDPGGFAAAAWTVSDTVVTLNPDLPFVCNTSYTVTTTEASIDAAAGTPTTLITTGPEDGDWSFTTASCSSTAGTPTVANTYTVDLTAPNGGESLSPGSVSTITWSTGGTGVSSNVNLAYSTDGGSTYTTIANNQQNNGSYNWTVPNVNTTNAKIRVQSTDLAVVLATDSSAATFTITGTVAVPAPEVNVPSTGTSGLSPVTGLPEEISEIHPGDYVRSVYFSTVYYIDANMIRHPFTDSQTFFTWQNSFSVVKTVTDATLPTLELGSPLLPKPGVVLVKIQSDNHVYAIEENPANAFKPILRWIASETSAVSLYGSDWADYVIDLPPTLFGKFAQGSELPDSTTINKSIMKKRVDLK